MMGNKTFLLFFIVVGNYGMTVGKMVLPLSSEEKTLKQTNIKTGV